MTQIEKPTVPEVLPLVKEYFRYNPSGGVFHVLLEDANTEQCYAESALQEAKDRNDKAAIHIAELLAKMSRTQRKKISQRVHG